MNPHWSDWLRFSSRKTRWAACAVAAIVFLFGVFWHHAGLLVGGAVALCFVLRRVSEKANPEDAAAENRHRRRPHDHRPGTKHVAHDNGNGNINTADESAPRVLNRSTHSGLPRNTETLVDELLATGRYALLLRPETKKHLTQTHIVRAIRQLDEAMALVPAGRVLLGQLAEQSNSACGSADVDPKLLQRTVSAVRRCRRLRTARILVRGSIAGAIGFCRSNGRSRPALLVRRAVSQRRAAATGCRHQLVRS
jgi:hypothetical protein